MKKYIQFIQLVLVTAICFLPKISLATPSAPSAPTVTATSSTSISISWTAVSGATLYKLYRSTSSSGTYTQIYYAATPSYTDSGSHLSSGTTYYYKVTAGDSTGWSGYSSVSSAITYPATPSTPTVTATGSSSIDISWSSVTGATLYKLYRSTSSSGTYTQIYYSSSPSYTDSGSHLSASTTYYYKLKAGNSSGWSGYSSVSSATTSAAIPSAPSAPTVTATGATSIDISWSSVSGATLYKLYRSTSSSGTYTQIYYAATPSYTDSGSHLSSGTTYYYKVTAGNSTGWSGYSSVSSAVTYPSTPSAPTVTATGSSSIDINWSSVTGATLYKLYRSTSSSGTYTQIYYSSTPSYTDSGSHLSASTTYYYKLKAGNSSGWSDYSSVTSATTSAAIPSTPSAPIVTATGSTSMSISWSSVSGATLYKLYRSTSSGGTYTQIYYSSSPSYTDSGSHLSGGTTYYYKVTAGNSTGWSDYSSVSSATTYPDAPSAPTATATGPISVDISWSSVSGATLYKLYRSTSSTGTYTQIYYAATPSYTDSGTHLSASTKYYYKVTAGNSSGWSDYSSTTSVTTLSGIPDAPSAPTVTATGPESITISWSAVTDATLYKLYRSDSEAGSYTQIYYSTDPSYTDSGTHLSAGTTYYYKVTAGNTYGWSDYSGVGSATTVPELSKKVDVDVEPFLVYPLEDNHDSLITCDYYCHLDHCYNEKTGYSCLGTDYDSHHEVVYAPISGTAWVYDSYGDDEEACDDDGYGNHVKIISDDGKWTVILGHMEKGLLISDPEGDGESVVAGETALGYTSNSGFTDGSDIFNEVDLNGDGVIDEYGADDTACTDDDEVNRTFYHLHLEVEYEGTDVDPYPNDWDSDGVIDGLDLFIKDDDDSYRYPSEECETPDSDSIFVAYPTTTTTIPDSSVDSKWDDFLEFKVSISGSNATFILTRSDHTYFGTYGKISLQVGTYESYGTKRGDPVTITSDDTHALFYDDFSDYCNTSYPKEYYIRFEETDSSGASTGDYTVVGPITIYQVFDGGSDESSCDVSSTSTFSADTSSISTTPDGAEVSEGWENALKLELTFDDTKGIFTVSKSTEGDTFENSGKMYLKVGAYESDSTTRAKASVNSGDSSVTFVDDFGEHCSYPKEYYVRFEATSGGVTITGPITVSIDDSTPVLEKPGSTTGTSSSDSSSSGSTSSGSGGGGGGGGSSPDSSSAGETSSGDSSSGDSSAGSSDGESFLDSDEDGISDDSDLCSSTTLLGVNDSVNSDGCALSDRDSDSDGLTDYAETVGEKTAYLVPDTTEKISFGYSVATSGDWLAVGSIKDDTFGEDAGSVTLYHWDGSAWVAWDTFVGSDTEAGDQFGGESLAMDGDILVVGASESEEDDIYGSAGAVYVFRWDGTSWNEEAKLVSDDPQEGAFLGTSVSVSGNTIIAGAPNDLSDGVMTGAAYVYQYDGTSWSQTHKLVPAAALVDDRFGISVSIDGDTLAVGAYLATKDDISSGAVWIYNFDGASWNETTQLVADDAADYDLFGYSISLNEGRLLVGAYGGDNSGSYSGAAYIFEKEGAEWKQQEKLQIDDSGADDYFGHSVSLDGDTAVVGAYGDSTYSYRSGAAYVYRYDGAEWQELYKLDAGDYATSSANFNSLDIDGNVVVIGGYYTENDWTGAVHVYDLTSHTNQASSDTDGDGLSDNSDPHPTNPDNDEDGFFETDCDNTNSSIYPGATETCGDGLDQDCDGLDKECSVTYTVTSTDDANDGKCNTFHCSLREALSLSKTDTSALTVNVVFSIPSTDAACSSGVCTISPTKALPSLTRGNTVIDGGGVVVIDGTSAGSTTKGITINDSSSNVIKNLTIQNFGSHGIYVTGTTSSNNEISGCYIGVDSSGTDQSNGGSGIYISSGSAVISSNAIAYNALKGVHLSSTSALGIIITQNSMHDNVSYGITLASSANNNKAKPVISAATVSGSTVTITGTSTAGDTIEIFNASTDSEGQTYIGETTADSSGNWSYVTNTTTAPKWSKLVATGTDSTNGTSPFSATKTVK